MIEKYWGGCGHAGHKVNGWMNGSIELIFMLMQINIPQLKNKSINWADFLHAGCDGSFWLEHELCSLSLGFKYWGSTVVVLHCNYHLLRCLLSFVAPQSLSHGQ